MKAHTGLVLLKAIEDIGAEPVVVAPEDPEAERANTWWLRASPDELATLCVADIVAALEGTAQQIRSKVAGMDHSGPVTFYVWHDEQAGQLRCSTSSRARTDLPFGSPYHATDDLPAIVEVFMSDISPGIVPLVDLEPVPDTTTEPGGGPPAFAVWTSDVATPPA